MEYDLDHELRKIDCDFGIATHLNEQLRRFSVLPGHYHLSCRLPLEPERILSRIVAAQYPFSLDFISSSIDVMIMKVIPWLTKANYIFVNQQEYCKLLALVNTHELKTVIVTNQEKPVRVYQFGEEQIVVPCPKRIPQNVTGAGDRFIGAFLRSRLQCINRETSVKNGILGAGSGL